jgi:autotransporter-associated beta strand protein
MAVLDRKLPLPMKNSFFLSRSSRLFLCVAAIAIAAVSTRSVRAADAMWSATPADNEWNDPANWTTGLPAAGDTLIFSSSTIFALNNDFPANTRFDGITFDAAAVAYTLDGAAITLGTPLTGVPSSGSITNDSVLTQTINLGITLGAGNHTIAGGVGLALNPLGGLLRNPGGVANFTGAVTTTTIVNDSSGIIGTWATYDGMDWATVDGGNIVAYSAYADVASGGTISTNPASNVRLTAPVVGNVTLAAPGTTDINSLAYQATGTSIEDSALQIVDLETNTLRLGAQGGILRFSTANGATDFNQLRIINGTLTAGGADNTPGEIVLNTSRTVGGTGTDLQILASVADNGTGAVSVVKTGRGYAQMNNDVVGNTYTGGTFINEGRLQASVGGTLLPYGTGDVVVQSGGQAFFSGAPANHFFIAGTGPQNEPGTGAIRGSGTMSGPVTLMADARISGAATMSGPITGSFNLEFGMFGNLGSSGTNLTISNPSNDWTGDTILYGRNTGASNTTLNLGASDVIPNGAGRGNVIIGNTEANAGSIVTLNLNGNNETINGLSSAGVAANDFVQNNAVGTTSILTLGDNNATATFEGIIRDGDGVVGITKIGTGEQTFSGANTYTGPTTVLGGTLTLTLDGMLADTSSVLLDGGVLNLTFAGTDTIGLLFIGGDMKEIGTWGATGSGAQFESAAITGSGLLLVTVPEPGTVALALIGISALLFHVRRRSRRAVSAGG